MKVFAALLIVLLVSQYYCEKTCSSFVSANSYDDCKDLKLSSNGYRCCYLEYTYDLMGEKVTTKRCDDISKYYYDNIDDYKDTIEIIVDALGGDNVNVKTIDCGSKRSNDSNYLVISLFSLILLFI